MNSQKDTAVAAAEPAPEPATSSVPTWILGVLTVLAGNMWLPLQL